MGIDCGPVTMWGICLNDEEHPELFALLGAKCDTLDMSMSQLLDEYPNAVQTVKDYLRAEGITLNDDMEVMYFSGDEAPARCETPPDSLVVGYGLTYRDPRMDPVRVDRSFAELANFWNWVWMY